MKYFNIVKNFLSQQDKQKHILATFAISYFMSFAAHCIGFGVYYVIGFTIAMLIGVLKEMYDMIGHGTFDELDIVADVIGSVFGSIVFVIFVLVLSQ